jgi:hypothetical protein
LEPEPEQVLAGNAFYDELCRRSAAYREGRTTARDASEFMADLFRMQTDEESR